MTERISRSERKRRLKRLEAAVTRLAGLSPARLRGLGLEEDLLELFLEAGRLKGGARRRQIRYITGRLRRGGMEDFLALAAAEQGRAQRDRAAFHELEYLRDQLMAEARERFFEADRQGLDLDEEEPLEATDAVLARFPGLDPVLLTRLALLGARTGRRGHGREIFRLLAAQARRAEGSGQPRKER